MISTKTANIVVRLIMFFQFSFSCKLMITIITFYQLVNRVLMCLDIIKISCLKITLITIIDFPFLIVD